MKKITLSFLVISFLLTTHLIATNLSTDKINEAISAKGGNWQAGITSMSKYLDSGEKPHMGLIQDESMLAFEIYTFSPYENYLSRSAEFDWRDVDGTNWMSPIRDQGRCGSCVAFATLGAFEAQLRISNLYPDYDFDLSEQQLFHCGGGACNQGMYLSGGASHLKRTGTCDEACVPYESGKMGADFECSALSCYNMDDRTLGIIDYTSVNSWSYDVQKVKAALAHGPLLTGMTVYEDFLAYKSGVYKHVTGEALGGHAIVIVGWEDENKAWIVRNSWGEDWGDQGYFKIDWYDASGVGKSAYNFDVPKFNGFVSLPQLSEENAFAGKVTLFAENTHPNITSAIFKLYVHQTNSEVFSANIDPSELIFEIDTLNVPDGMYDATIVVSDGEFSYYSEFKRFYVLNNKQDLRLTINSPSSGDTLKEKVYIEFSCQDITVPLSSMDFYIKGPDGEKIIEVKDPCPQTLIGWRTNYYADGEYELFGIGKVGELATYESNYVYVNVAN
ncbi:MAG: C1 family peptidase [Pseudomonadota bacterium]